MALPRAQTSAAEATDAERTESCAQIRGVSWPTSASAPPLSASEIRRVSPHSSARVSVLSASETSEGGAEKSPTATSGFEPSVRAACSRQAASAKIAPEEKRTTAESRARRRPIKREGARSKRCAAARPTSATQAVAERPVAPRASHTSGLIVMWRSVAAAAAAYVASFVASCAVAAPPGSD